MREKTGRGNDEADVVYVLDQIVEDDHMIPEGMDDGAVFAASGGVDDGTDELEEFRDPTELAATAAAVTDAAGGGGGGEAAAAADGHQQPQRSAQRQQPPGDGGYGKLRVAQLREMLGERGRLSTGKKAALVARLEETDDASSEEGSIWEQDEDAVAEETAQPVVLVSRSGRVRKVPSKDVVLGPQWGGGGGKRRRP